MDQNKISKIVVFWLLILLATIWLFSGRNAVKTSENAVKTDTVLVNVQRYNDNVDWEAFIEALIWVESKGVSNAVGSSDDVGVLQLTPVYVQQVNNILGGNIYTLEDRRDSLKSVEMFNVVQNYYNQERDLHWGIKLHNPRAPWSYHVKVMIEYNKRRKK